MIAGYVSHYVTSENAEWYSSSRPTPSPPKNKQTNKTCHICTSHAWTVLLYDFISVQSSWTVRSELNIHLFLLWTLKLWITKLFLEILLEQLNLLMYISLLVNFWKGKLKSILCYSGRVVGLYRFKASVPMLWIEYMALIFSQGIK